MFDLGGVLAQFGGVERMRVLARVDTAEQMWLRWLTCEWVRAFERGRCSREDFAAGVVADWELAIAPQDFLAEFSTWLVGPLPGAAELVDAVRAHVPVGCLSNTNEVHWEAGAHQWPLLQRFDHTFLSFELGMVKPDPEIFAHVVTELGVPAPAVLFLDDNQLNVDAARDAGITARLVVGVDEARRALADTGVLPSAA